MVLHYWGDGSVYGDGDLYTPLARNTEYGVEYETRYHRVSIRLEYTAEAVSGAADAFVIHSIRLRLGERAQQSFTHEVFVDCVSNSERVSAKVSHAGSEFILSSMQLIAQRKRKQPKG